MPAVLWQSFAMDTSLPAISVVSSINLDLMARAERLPTPGETIGGAVLSEQPGGKGSNQAAEAARLGGSARMVGAVGSDDQASGCWTPWRVLASTLRMWRSFRGATGTALIVVDREGENQIVVCPRANAKLSLDGVDFEPEETVLCQPAMGLPDELLDRCDLVIVNESEYALVPSLASAKLVAVT